MLSLIFATPAQFGPQILILAFLAKLVISSSRRFPLSSASLKPALITIDDLTPFWILVLFVFYCLWIFLLYITLGVRKSKEYLQKIVKWDSPKVVVLMLILVWVVFGVLYYIRPYLWIFIYGICSSLAILSAVYMRNVYRKQIDLKP